MPRGERIGHAYIRVTADASSIPGDVRDGLEDAEPTFERAGREGGRSYASQFTRSLNEELEKSFEDTSDALGDTIKQAVRRIDMSEDWLKGTRWSKIKKDIAAELGGIEAPIAERMFEKMEERLRAGGGIEGLARDLQQIDRLRYESTQELAKELDDLDKQHEAAIREDLKREEKRSREIQKEIEQRLADEWNAYETNERRKRQAALDALIERDRIEREQFRIYNSYMEDQYKAERIRMERRNRDLANAEKKIANDRIIQFRELTKNYSRIHEDVEKYRDGLENSSRSKEEMLSHLQSIRREWRQMGNDQKGYLSRNHDAMTDYRRLGDDIQRARVQVVMVNRPMRRLGRQLDVTGVLMGRAFGKGSRNNFLNFTGSMVQGFMSITSGAFKAAGGVFEVGKAFSESFKIAKEAGETGFKAFTTGVAGMAKQFPKLAALLNPGTLIAAIAGIGIALVSASFVLTTFASLLAMVGGLVTALASTIGFALVASLGALAGALMPIGGFIAVIAGGIMSLDDASRKAVGQGLRPLTNEFKALGRAGATEMFKDIDSTAKELAPSVRKLRPLFADMGKAVRDSGKDLAKSFKSPGWDAFIKDMRGFLPDAMRSLGRIMGNTFSGMGAIFRGLIPITREFLTWLEGITESFAGLNSEAGQDKIKGFMERAGESAKSLGRFIKEALGLIGDLFGASRESGNNIFDGMTNGIKEFRDYLERNPEAVANFFDDVEEFAGSAGRAIKNFGQLLDDLDTAGARDNLNTLISVITAVGDAIYAVAWTGATIWNTFISIVAQGAELLSSGVSLAIRGILLLIDAWNSIPGVAKVDTTGLQKALDDVDGMAAGIRGLKADLGALQNSSKVTLTVDDKGLTVKKKEELQALGFEAQAVDGKIVWVKTDDRGSTEDLEKDLKDLDVQVRKTDGSTVTVKGKQSGLTTLLGQIRQVREAAGVFTVQVKGGKLTANARGRMVTSPMVGLVGEAGPEAIVPMDRPLSQVDPEVRWLSAIAQGKAPPPSGGAGTGGGRSITIGEITVVSNSEDPRAVAQNVLDKITSGL